MGSQVVDQPTTRSTSLAGTGFWYLWITAVSFSLIVSADRFTFIWLVDDTLGSPTWASGLIVFALGAPVFALVLTAGALTDRLDRKKMLLVTQGAGLAVVALGAVLVWVGVISLTWAVLLALGFGTVAAFAMPVRSSLVPALVGRERVMQAVVMMTIGANVAMIAGPLLVGGVIDAFGVGWAFAVQALCFALGFAAATRIEVPPHPPVAERRRLRAEVAEAVSFVWRHEVLRPLFALLCVGGGLMGGGSFTLLPQIARDEFGRSASEAARLFALMGLGMIITSLMLMRFRSRLRRRGLVFMAFMVVGTANQVLQGWAPTFALLQVLLLLWGLTGGFYMNLNQSLIQELTPQDRMGRVMALNSLVQAGLMPIGGLLAGVLAQWIGAPLTLSLFGAAGLASVIIALLRADALRALP